ncbi:MAG: hypothetical protein O3B31_14345 [Chloroflexi bacterium]|nr:hypothetical protein [Chloroflexota bacterium]
MPGVFSRSMGPVDPSKCFVMMPFAESFNAIYRLIQRVCTDQELRCERADEDVLPGKITGKIYDAVATAGVIIADMSGRNANVFYELGLAHAMSDNVILLTQSGDDVPFDLRDFIHIEYNNTFEGAEKLANELSKVLTTLLRSAGPATIRRAVPDASVAPEDFEQPDLGLFDLQAETSRRSGDLAAAHAWLSKALQYAKGGRRNGFGSRELRDRSRKLSLL